MSLPAWYGKLLATVVTCAALAATALAPTYGHTTWYVVAVAVLGGLGIHGTLYTPPAPAAGPATVAVEPPVAVRPFPPPVQTVPPTGGVL